MTVGLRNGGAPVAAPRESAAFSILEIGGALPRRRYAELHFGGNKNTSARPARWRQ